MPKLIALIPIFLLLLTDTKSISSYLSIVEKINTENVLPIDLQIKIEKDRIFGINDNVLMGTIRSIHVDQKNRVFIGDSDQTKIHVFEPNGKYVTSLGRKGRGPGDYSAISWRTTITSDSEFIYITDSSFFNPRRANVYALDDLSFSHVLKLYSDDLDEYELLRGYGPTTLYPEKDGTFLVPYSKTIKNVSTGTGYIFYLKQDIQGNILSEPIYKQEGVSYLIELVTKNKMSMEVMHTFPFHGSSLFTPSSEGIYYSARTEEFKIDVLDKQGKLIRTIEHPFDNKALDVKALIKRYEQTNYMSQLGEGVAVEMLRNAESLPTEWPALKSMQIDNENRLWISTIVGDTSIYEWWVIESSGKLITKFIWPRNKPIQQIRNGCIYTKERDETGAEYVVKYRFEFKEKQ
ncbi:MAG: 6-bladed beta-propeller [Balneola sp.]